VPRRPTARCGAAVSLDCAQAHPVAVVHPAEVAPAVTATRLTAGAAARALPAVAHLADRPRGACRVRAKREAHAAVVARVREVAGIADAALLSNPPAGRCAIPVAGQSATPNVALRVSSINGGVSIAIINVATPCILRCGGCVIARGLTCTTTGAENQDPAGGAHR